MKHILTPLSDRGPLRVMFLLTSMPVGGAETLLVNLIRRLDRRRFAPEICCLKALGPLGETLSQEIPAHCGLIGGKYDFRVLFRLTRLFRSRKIDAVVTVGAGDKMFWGRLAAWRAGVPVVASAIHSTGWPDGIGRLNRCLTRITDAFIGVAEPHGRHLREVEGFPAAKVHVIPNGVDTVRFAPRTDGFDLRRALGIPTGAPVVGIVAALRPEKNHELFLNGAAALRREAPDAHFVLVGDGPERPRLEELARTLQIADSVHFLGTRADTADLVAQFDVFQLTSHVEANPVSILEALSSEVPCVATRVGSVPETVQDEVTGYTVKPGSVAELTARTAQLLHDPALRACLGRAGRQLVVDRFSLDAMVAGYADLIEGIYSAKAGRPQSKLEIASAESDRTTVGV